MDRQKFFKAKGATRAERRLQAHENEKDRRRTKRLKAMDARRNIAATPNPKKTTRMTTRGAQKLEEEQSLKERLKKFQEKKALRKKQEALERAKNKPFVVAGGKNAIPVEVIPLPLQTIMKRPTAFPLKQRNAQVVKKPLVTKQKEAKASRPTRQFKQKENKKKKKKTPAAAKGFRIPIEFGKEFSPFHFTFSAPSIDPPPPPQMSLAAAQQEFPAPETLTPFMGKCDDVKNFRRMLQSETHTLMDACNKWMEFLDQDLPERASEMLHSAVGMAKLLMSQKFKFFEKLCDDAEDPHCEKEVTVDDLQGYWDVVSFQIDDVNGHFGKIQKCHLNGWRFEETPKPKKKIRKIRKKTPCPIRRSTRLKSFLKRVKATKVVKDEEGSSDIVIFKRPGTPLSYSESTKESCTPRALVWSLTPESAKRKASINLRKEVLLKSVQKKKPEEQSILSSYLMPSQPSPNDFPAKVLEFESSLSDDELGLENVENASPVSDVMAEFTFAPKDRRRTRKSSLMSFSPHRKSRHSKKLSKGKGLKY